MIDPDLSAGEKQELVRKVARRLDSRAHGDPADPQTWWRVARKLNCRIDIYRDPTGGYGTYVPDPQRAGAGLITYNASQPQETQVRVLQDLLSHHLLHWWLPEQSRD